MLNGLLIATSCDVVRFADVGEGLRIRRETTNIFNKQLFTVCFYIETFNPDVKTQYVS